MVGSKMHSMKVFITCITMNCFERLFDRPMSEYYAVHKSEINQYQQPLTKEGFTAQKVELCDAIPKT